MKKLTYIMMFSLLTGLFIKCESETKAKENKTNDCISECSDCKGRGFNYSEEDIARFVIAQAFSKDPKIIKAQKVSTNLYSVTYKRAKDKKERQYMVKFKWKGELCSEVNRAYWAGVENGILGRWRDTNHDEKIEFKEANGKIIVRVIYSDKSEETSSFDLKD